MYKVNAFKDGVRSSIIVPLFVLALFIIPCALPGCWSSPARTVTPKSGTAIPVDKPRFTIYVQECSNTGDNAYKNACTIFREQLIESLESTGIFYPASGQLSSNVDYEVKLLGLPNRSPYYYNSLGHFPPAYILSAVLPLWETTEYGFEFQIRNLRNGRKGVIDSRERGTTVFWILAPLLNLFPERIWERRSMDETSDLRNRILNKISEIIS
jgi:hypothetical protein